MKSLPILLILCGLALSACGRFEVSVMIPATATPTITALPAPSPFPTQVEFQPTSLPPLTYEQLANAEYRSTVLEADQAIVTLENGVHTLPHLPEESDSAWHIGLTGDYTYGDLDGDGQLDAAVILETQRGGTGHFYELAAVLNQGGAPYNVASISLGDRVIIRSVFIQDGVIRLDLVVHGPNDPLASPSLEKTVQYRLSGADLITLADNPEPGARVTVTPFTPFPEVVCSYAWFFTFEYENLSLAHTCPDGVVLLDAVGQDFEGGRVIRLAPDPSHPEFPNGVLYVIYNDGEWETFADEWTGGLPPSDPSILPPSDRYQPLESIGWIWREYTGVRRRLGWAYEPQAAFQGRYQTYLAGENPRYTFFDHGKWGLVLLLDAAPGGPNTWSVVGAY